MLGGGNIVFGAASELTLKRADAANGNVTFDLMNHIDPGTANQGIVILDNSSTGTGKLILQATGGKTLGNLNAIAELRITGANPVEIISNLAVNATAINVLNGAYLLINHSAVTSDIDIGAAPAGGAAGGAIVAIDFTNAGGAADLLNGKTITFSHGNSVLVLVNNSTATNQTVTLKANLAPGAANTGVLNLQADKTATAKNLTIANHAAETIGGALSQLKAINSLGGTVIINSDVPVFAETINVLEGSLQGDAETMTEFADITIGTVDVAAVNPNPAVLAKAATLILDGTTNNAATLLGGGKTIKFNSQDSVLQLTGANAGDITFTLDGGNLAPTLVTAAAGSADADETGILQLTSGMDAQSLIVDTKAAETIGTSDTLRLKQLIIDGDSLAGTRATEINSQVYAKTITVGNAASANANGALITFTKEVDTGAGGSLVFAGPSQLGISELNTPTIDFATKVGTITVTNNGVVAVDTISNGTNAQLIFARDGDLKVYSQVVGATVTAKLAKISAGAGEVTLPPGAFTVAEIIGTGTNKLTLKDGFNLTGAINSTGGAVLPLVFEGSSTISSTIGAGNAVGDITIGGAAGKIVAVTGAVKAAKVQFTGGGTLNANAGITGDVDLNNAGIVNVTGALDGAVTSTGTGTLAVNNGITGNVAVANGSVVTVTGGNVGGTLTITDKGQFVGAGADIAQLVTINSAVGASASSIRNAANGVTATAGTLVMGALGGNMGINAATVTASGLVTGNVTFAGAGTLNANAGITGDVEMSNGGTVTVAGALLTGDVTFAGAGTLNANAGITGAVDLSNGGAVNVTGAALTGNVTSTGTGTLNVDNGITGNVAVANKSVVRVTGGNVGGTLTITDKGQFVGAGADIAQLVTINSAVGASASSIRNAANGVTVQAGTLNVRAITGGGIAVTAGANLNIATAYVGNYAGPGNVAFNAGITGNVDLNNNNIKVTGALDGAVTSTGTGTLAVDNGITGNVVVANKSVVRVTGGNVGGTLTITGNGQFVGAGADIAQLVTINSAGAASSIRNAANGVTATAGTLNMRALTGGNMGINAATVTASGLVTGNVTFAGAGTLNANAGITGAVDFANTAGIVALGGGQTITGAVDSTVGAGGILKLAGAGTVTGAIGKTSALTEIQFNGTGAVGFDNATLKATTLKFTAGAVTLTTSGVDLGATNIANTSPAGTAHKIIVDANQTITGNIASAANPFGTIEVDGDRTVKIETTEFNAAVTTKTKGEVTVDLNKTGLVLNKDLGTALAKLKKIQFTKSAEIKGKAYATDAAIAIGKIATFTGGLTADNLTLAGAGSQAIFADGVILDSKIIGTVPNEGILKFRGAAEIKKEIGAIKEIDFTAANTRAKQIKLSKDIGGLAKFDKATVTIVDNLEIKKGATFNGTKIELGEKKLTLSGGNVTLAGAVEVTTTLKNPIPGSGAIDVSIGGNNLDFTGIKELLITANENGLLQPAGTTDYIILNKTAGNVVGLDKSKIKTGNLDTNFTKWRIAVADDGKITLTRSNEDVAKVLKQTLIQSNIPVEEVNPQDVEAFVKAPIGTEASNFVREQTLMDEGSIVEANQRLFNNNSITTSTVIADTISEVTVNIADRISTIIAPSFFQSSAPSTTSPSSTSSTIPIKTSSNDSVLTGVAAGDAPERHGIWVSPFFSQGEQKKLRGVSGHKSRSSGITAGFDTLATEDMLVGAAGTFIGTKIDHKNFKKGDKTSVDTVLFTAYGVQQMTNNSYIQGIINFGSSRVHNNEIRRNSNTSTQIAKSNYTSMSFGAEVLAGYNHVISNKVVFSPMIGLNYSQFNDSSYSETGTTNQNTDVLKKASNKLEGMLGARIVTSPFELNGVDVSPEVRASVRQILTAKKGAVELRLDGAPNVQKAVKLIHTYVNLGTGINANYNSIDYGISYDTTIANKYISHQGTLKVRVNF
jgi:outer membrane autotransporter protein